LSAWRLAPATADDVPTALRMLTGAGDSGRPFDLVLCDDAGTGLEDTAPRVVRMGGANAALNRPIRQSQLYDLLISVFGTREDRPLEETPASLERRGHVLLVEDNAINQTVALGILARLGFTADVAPDGRVAVELAARNDYLAIFMDCLMPEMDGYTATAEIRRSVMPQDITSALERCTARPSIRRQIEQRLDLLRAAAPTIDDEALAGLLRRLIAQVPDLVEEAMQALALDDAPALRHAAHQLKGAAANLGAQDLADAADRLERAARTGGLEAAVEPVTLLRAAARETVDAVHAMAVSAKA
jgi:CheY-like chemotaxis protein